MERPFLVAAILGLCSIVLGLIAAITGAVMIFTEIFESNGVSALTSVDKFIQIALIIGLVTSILRLGFYYGFVAYGDKYNDKFLRAMGIVLIVVLGVGVLLTIYSYSTEAYVPNLTENQGFLDTIKEQYKQAPTMKLFLDVLGEGSVWFIIAIMLLGGVALRIVFGVALIRQKANLMKISGWLECVGVVINLATLAAMILQIIEFFKEDKKRLPLGRRKLR